METIGVGGDVYSFAYVTDKWQVTEVYADANWQSFAYYKWTLLLWSNDYFWMKNTKTTTRMKRSEKKTKSERENIKS